jgi:hypothetical protein
VTGAEPGASLDSSGQLVALGLTNRQVAVEMFLGSHTVAFQSAPGIP